MTRRDSPPEYLGGGGACVRCGKRNYFTKAEAKRAARGFESRSGKLRPYRCGDAWHLGHLPTRIRQGEVTRDIYRQDTP